MSMTWQEILASNRTGSGSSFFTNFTTPKSIIPTSAVYVIQEDFFDVGRVLHVKATGKISNIVTTPGTIIFHVMFNGSSMVNSGNIQLSSTAHTQIPYWVECFITCQALGSGTAAVCMHQWRVFSQAFSETAVADSVESHTMLMAPNTAPGVGAGFSSTAKNTIDFMAGFSIANAGNGISSDMYSLSVDN